MKKDSTAISPDPCPSLVVERGPRDKGVGSWVPYRKHHLLYEYLHSSRYAWKKWPSRVFIDPFAGPGRIQVAGEAITRDGGAVLAWRTLSNIAPFTQMFVGDIDPLRAAACKERLSTIGAPVTSFVGPAEDTVKLMVAAVPAGSLCMAYIDPYNLELLTFSILKELAKLRKVDLAINFSTMDLQRNVELEFDPQRARFDGTAPGWRSRPEVLTANKQNLRLVFFNYWCELVKNLGFDLSKEMPLVDNDHGHPIYRMVFFARGSFPTRIWGDVAKGPNKDLFAD
jgi:three-Cys-motif partner protein